MHSIGVVLVTVYTYHTHVCAHVHTSTIQLSILTVCRYRRSIDTDVLGHYRVCIDEVFRLYRRSIEYRDVCIEYRRAGLGVQYLVE